VAGESRSAADTVSLGDTGARHRLSRIPRLTFAAVGLVRRAAPRQLWATVALQVVIAVLVGAQLLIGKTLIAQLLEIDPHHGADLAHLIPAFAGLILANAGSGAATALLGQQQQLLTELVSRHTLDGIIDVAGSVSLASYEDPDFYDHLERARAAGMYRPIEMVNNVISFGTAALTSVGVAGALLTLEPVLLPLVLIAGVPLLLAALYNSRQSYAFEYAMTVRARERLHLMNLLTGRDSAKELRVFDAVGFLRRRYDELTQERLDKMRSFLRGRLGVSLVGTTATAIGTALAIGSLVWLLATGRTEVSTAVTAALAMQVLASRLSAMTAALSKIVEAGLFLDDFHRFLALGAADRALDAPEARPPERFEGLRIEHVGFTYPNTDRPVLDDVSLEVNPGEVVALVGENGSGKTTLVKLVSQLYRDVGAGRILWSGVDAPELDPRAIQEQLTVLFQDFVQYELSVADNIALGRAESDGDGGRVQDAARRAGAHELIERLPRGYATRLGRQFFGGQELSGGQWQRLALARAFYRGGEFLILDEPTAALDPRAEADLFEQVRALAAGRSVLLISHRFSSVRMADRIYVLEAGRVVESGAHDDLMARDGLYAELFSLQAAAYLGERGTARGTTITPR
jgi:ATP-binding cassette subfamily B protein